MGAARRPSARARPRARPRRRAPPAPAFVEEPPAITKVGSLEPERPHAHIVCRVCGRIQAMELTELDCHLLTQLADQRPDGWSVDRIAFSVAGACQRCREGPHTP